VPWPVLLAVAAYGLLATLAAVYGLFLRSADKLPADHPLSTIPDTFGEFDPPSRKKVSQYRFPVDGELPAQLKTGLGGKIEVGQLVIEPVQVAARPLRVITEAAAGKQEAELPRALVLRLRVTNTSPELAIFPMDPAFSRKATRDDRHPATRLVVGRRTFYGGAIEWPVSPGVSRKYDQQQADDATPLGPGQSREYVVFTDVDQGILDSVRIAREPLLWRVQVRRGLIEFRQREVPVTAIVGVEFSREQIENLN
jgi:hypothetical protein